jgi:beta-mannanase
MVLRYHDFSTHQHQGEFPDRYQVDLGQSRTLVLAWQARVNSTGQDLRWSDITAGRQDERINAAARRIKSWGKEVIIAFDPEFDRFEHKGTMAEYAAAYRYIHQKFAAAGVTNVVWAWVPAGYVTGGNDKITMAGYPGSQYVDWVGFDPYNFFTCNGSNWNNFESEISPMYNFYAQQGLGSKPILLMEYGTEHDENNPARSTAWHREIPSVLKKYPNIKGLIRFDDGSTTATCNQAIENGPGMLDSFRQAGLDPYVNTR